MPVYERTDDDGPRNPREFSRADVAQIKELLAKAEEAKALHIFTANEIETLRRVIKTFEDHGSEISEMIKREAVSHLWMETRLRFWGIIKWLLATFLMIVAAVQGWQSIIAPMMKWGGGK
jgi:hypothetical protein